MPRCPSCSRQLRGHTSHWIRPSSSRCQYRVATTLPSAGSKGLAGAGFDTAFALLAIGGTRDHRNTRVRTRGRGAPRGFAGPPPGVPTAKSLGAEAPPAADPYPNSPLRHSRRRGPRRRHHHRPSRPPAHPGPRSRDRLPPSLGSPSAGPPSSSPLRSCSTRPCTLVPRDVDRYGRLVAVVFVGHTDVNLELVRRGLAWHFTRYSSDPQPAAAERSARATPRTVGGRSSHTFLGLASRGPGALTPARTGRFAPGDRDPRHHTGDGTARWVSRKERGVV